MSDIKSSSLQLYDKETLTKKLLLECSSSGADVTNDEKVRFHFVLDLDNGKTNLVDVQSVVEKLVEDVATHYVHFSNKGEEYISVVEVKVASVNNKIDTEVATRVAADLAQTQSRVQEKLQLLATIEKLESDLKVADDHLSTDISAEISRAKIAETKEKVDREAAVASIQSSLQFLQDNANAEALASLGKLIEDFKAVDSTVQSSIVSIRTDIDHLKLRFDELVGTTPV